MLKTETIQATTITLPCTDGIAWCDGLPANHTSDDDHRHTGPEHALNGTYLCDGPGAATAGFQLAQWGDSQPHLTFQGTGLWADLTLSQVGELRRDLTGHLIRLVAVERHLTILLNPGRTPFAESDSQQLASAAFRVAVDAVEVALAKSEDRATTLRALHAYLGLAETEPS